jgi:hypothetical protein
VSGCDDLSSVRTFCVSLHSWPLLKADKRSGAFKWQFSQTLIWTSVFNYLPCDLSLLFDFNVKTWIALFIYFYCLVVLFWNWPLPSVAEVFGNWLKLKKKRRNSFQIKILIHFFKKPTISTDVKRCICLEAHLSNPFLD